MASARADGTMSPLPRGDTGGFPHGSRLAINGFVPFTEGANGFQAMVRALPGLAAPV
jgi:hypothetical protein